MACVASLHSFGSFAAIIGSIIAKLKDESSPIHMTVEEETWFGKQKKNNFYYKIFFLLRIRSDFPDLLCHFNVSVSLTFSFFSFTN